MPVMNTNYQIEYVSEETIDVCIEELQALVRKVRIEGEGHLGSMYVGVLL